MLLQLIGIGLISGVMMGSIGIGSGAVVVPLLLLSGFSIQEATVVVLITQIIPQTIPALVIYYKKNIFPWKEGLIISGAGIIGSTLGAFLVSNGYIPIKFLYQSAAIFLTVIGLYMCWKYL
jgi:hypothetical protein